MASLARLCFRATGPDEDVRFQQLILARYLVAETQLFFVPRSGVIFLLVLLPAAPKPPQKKMVEREEFERSAVVRESVLRRAAGACEYPGCSCALFERENGRPYLEVHHVISLKNGGPDHVSNAAAPCPHWHRAQHHAKDQEAKAKTLRIAIKKKVSPWISATKPIRGGSGAIDWMLSMT